MDENTLVVMNEDGHEIEMTILFTFKDEHQNRDYVVYYDPDDESGNTYASIYDDEGHLFPIESEEEWDMIEEVLGSFLEENPENSITVTKEKR